MRPLEREDAALEGERATEIAYDRAEDVLQHP
jgi:hypothetical protein